MRVKLSMRLQAILELMEPCEVFTDIGSDHGLLAMAAIMQGKAGRVVATDIREAPLAAAHKAIAAQGLEQQIRLLLSDGFASLDPQDLQQIVIAGMGGSLIRQIIQRARQRGLDFDTHCRRLVLQPMNHQGGLRHWLASVGWEIIAERILAEKRHYYQIIVTRPGGAPYSLTWLEEHLGPYNLEHRDIGVESCVAHEIRLRQGILLAMQQGEAYNPCREEQLRRELLELQQVI
ncbi:MAG: class I SAM-dependent methyltransferase [Symbiobacteriaceae bacterium]|nr:class I SAM-dependent methyltransferase [Symbiobacteriaceae bacterium]